MNRIKTIRVKEIINSCMYWMNCDEQSLFRDEVRYLIKEAGEDHPLVESFLNNPKVNAFLNK